jgi:hypothetical protein
MIKPIGHTGVKQRIKPEGSVNRKWWLPFIILCFTLKGLSQNKAKQDFAAARQDSLDKLKDDSLQLVHKNSHKISFTMDYTSKVVFRGRDFGKKQYGFTPNILYKNPNGMYASINAYLWSGITAPVAKTDLGIGYEKDIGKHYSVNLSYERWFFAADTFFDPSALNNMAALELSTDFEKLNLQFGSFYIWGNQKALLVNLATDYRWDITTLAEKINIAIDPTVLAESFAGSNLISVNTFKNRARKDQSNHLIRDLQMANYEFSLPVVIEYKNLTITPTWHYSYPIPVSNEDPPLSPYLKGGFNYFTVTLLYDLYISRKHGKRQKANISNRKR